MDGDRRPAAYLRARPDVALSLVVIGALLLAAALAPVIAPYPYEAGDLDRRLTGPSLAHPLGTDQVGRDILSRLIYGARESVLLGAGAVLLSQALATVAGIGAAYAGGWLDLAILWLTDILTALPSLLLLIFVIGTVGGSLAAVLGALALLLFAGSARVIRAATLSLRGEGYVETAQGLGAGWAQIVRRHILPNVLPLIAVQAALQLGAAIVIESSLSFLGYGVPPPRPTWGRMLADARGDLTQPGGFNLALWPGLAITLAVYALTTAGDGLHDLLSGRRRR